MKTNFSTLKGMMLCEGVNADPDVQEMFRRQNPSNVKRGGLSAGGKMYLNRQCNLPVNTQYYRELPRRISLTKNPEKEDEVDVMFMGDKIACAEVQMPSEWYGEKVGPYDITQILTVHNRRLVAAVFEGCGLALEGRQCKFCIMDRSLEKKDPNLLLKKPKLFVDALKSVPLDWYYGLILNTGTTNSEARGLEFIEPVVRAVRRRFPQLKVSVEAAPPANLDWIDKIADAGADGIMMNFECFDPDSRRRFIPGKDKICTPDMYYRAFDRALKVLGEGRVTSSLVLGTEPVESLMNGIRGLVQKGVIPSVLAGTFFEGVPGFSFNPNVDYNDYLYATRFTRGLLRESLKDRLEDKVGCSACGMCDMINDDYALPTFDLKSGL